MPRIPRRHPRKRCPFCGALFVPQPRRWRRGVECVNPAHADGLLATKSGAQGQWQVQAVEQLGPHARQYLTLIRAGMRSLRAELERLLLLTTPYGPAQIEAALGALLAQAIVGSDHVERWLRLQTQGPVAPLTLEAKLLRLQ